MKTTSLLSFTVSTAHRTDKSILPHNQNCQKKILIG
jgi:hypothetical protein